MHIQKLYTCIKSLLILQAHQKGSNKTIQDHSDRNNTPAHQSSYKINHSCETALLFLHNGILTSFAKQEIINLCTIDLSSAFDTVGHGIKISTMENTFGLSGNTLSWLSSYLALHSFNISIEGNMSVDKPVTFLYPKALLWGLFYSISMLAHFQSVLSMMAYLLTGSQMTLSSIIPMKEVISVQRPIPSGSWRTPFAVSMTGWGKISFT